MATTRAGIEVEGLRELRRDLGGASYRSSKAVEATMLKAAFVIRDRLRTEAVGSDRFARVAASLGFDVYLDAGVDIEIGPETGLGKDRQAQGGLAYIAYEGSARSGPVFPDPQLALEAESEKLERYLAEAVGAAVLP